MTLKNFYNHRYTKNMLKHHVWIIWMSLLLNGLCTLLPMSLAVTESFQSEANHGAEYILISNIALYIVTAAGAKIAGAGMFKYLNNKSEVDFYHSVPVKKSGLFFSRYMTGVTAYLTGLKLMYFATAILGLATGIIELNQLWPMFITLVSVILTFLGVYSFVVWGTVITGNIFMSMATAFGIMFSPIFFTVIIVNLCDIQLQTFTTSGSTIVESVFKWTNPCFAALSPFMGYEVGATVGIIPMFFIWIVVTIFAFLSFMKRKSESAGTPVAITFYRPIIKGLGVTAVALISGFVFGYANSTKFYLVSFVMGIVFHIAFEMLFASDVKGGLKNIKHYLFYYGIVALLFLTISLDLAGYDKRIESLEDIKSITYNGIELEEKENLEILYKWIKSAVENMEYKGPVNYEMEMNDDFYGYNGLQQQAKESIYETIVVTLNNGDSYVRLYGFHDVVVEDIATIETSEEYLSNVLVYKLSEFELASIKIETNSRPWVELNNSAMELSTDTFFQVYELLIEQQELLTVEYVRENTPVLAIRVYIHETGENKYLYVYDVHQEVIELLGMNPDPIDDNTHMVMGNIYSDVLSSISIQFNKEWNNQYTDYAGYSMEWTDEQLNSLTQVIKPIYGNSSLGGNYRQDNKPLVFFLQNNSEYIGYITVEELVEIVQ